ncbi:thioredoxin-like protein [Zopfochytrium polystomum]|nr:thioredoxin-like protein [Zopfochytrium polystomum]
MRTLNLFWFFATAVIALALTGTASAQEQQQRKLTQEEIDARARIADGEIWHMGPGVLEERIKEGSWLVFFGARWCKFCKRLTPRWLHVQRRYVDEKIIEKDFFISKVDCTDVDAWCADLKVDSYPTLYLYHNGELIEEYQGEHEPVPIMDYIRDKAEKYRVVSSAVAGDSAQPVPTAEIVATGVAHSEL